MQPEPGDAHPPARRPELPDSERQLVVAKLEEAVGAGTLALDEFIARLDTVYGATSREDLATALDALPHAAPVGGGRRVSRLISVFGDEHRSGLWWPSGNVTVVSVFGDTTLDLRGAHVVDDEVVVRCWSVFGDVELILPDGVEVDLSGFCLFGDRTIDVEPVPRIAGTPRVRLVAFGLFGDAAVRSGSRTRRRKKWF